MLLHGLGRPLPHACLSLFQKLFLKNPYVTLTTVKAHTYAAPINNICAHIFKILLKYIKSYFLGGVYGFYWKATYRISCPSKINSFEVAYRFSLSRPNLFLIRGILIIPRFPQIWSTFFLCLLHSQSLGNPCFLVEMIKILI